MSRLTAGPLLLEALKQNCIDAWGLRDSSVDFQIQRLGTVGVPRAIISVLTIPMDFSGKGVEQTYSFQIVGTFAFPPPGVNIAKEQFARQNELIEKIITGPNYFYGPGPKDKAYLPIIREVSSAEDDDPQRRFYEVSLTFECKVRVEHHPGAFGG